MKNQIQVLKYTILTVIFSFIAFFKLFSQDEQDKRPVIFFPKAYNTWDVEVTAGVSLTKLPMAVVEEEINQSPMIESHFRIGIPSNLSITLEAKSNYIANYGSLGIQWSFLNNRLSAAIGGRFSAWFGHLELEAIRLKAEGMILSPYLTVGYDFDEYLLSIQIETQTYRMWTQIDERELGKLDDKLGGVAVNINVEQPLWHNHWVVMGVKLNYAKFFYQSWLSYSTIDEFLLYPEFKFGFVL
ncbi:hypothetical protein ACFLSQ_03225 [Bacteroidota bacterium]